MAADNIVCLRIVQQCQCYILIPRERRKEMLGLNVIHRCVAKIAPRSLSENVRTNGVAENRKA